MEEENVREILSELFLLCRLCINKNGKFAIIPGTQIHTSIKEIYRVQIEPYDGFSQLLCQDCKDKLIYILNLRATYVTNQEILIASKIHYDQEQEKRNEVSIQIKQEPEENQFENLPASNTPTNQESDLDEQILAPEPGTTNNPTNNLELSNIEEEIERKFVDISNQFEYEYYCRICNNCFDSVDTLKEHVKTHSRLIILQRRYTPYMCSVKLSRLDEFSGKSLTKLNQRNHPLFYMKRKITKNTNLTQQKMGSDSGSENSSENGQCESISDITENNSQQSKQQLYNEFENVEQYTSRPINIRNTAVSGTEVPILTNETNLNMYESGTIPDSIYKSIYPQSFAREEVFNEILNNEEQSLGEILREVNAVLEDDMEVKFDLINEMYKQQIDEIIYNNVVKYVEKENEDEFNFTQNMLLYLCKKRLKVKWKEDKSDINITFKYENDNGNDIINDFCAATNAVAKKSTVSTYLVEQNTNSRSFNILTETTNNSESVKTTSDSEDTDVNYDGNSVMSGNDNVDINDTTDNEQTNMNVNYPVIPENGIQQTLLPLIVSATSIAPSAIVEETTMAYLDLESDDNTISSEKSPELTSPIKFFQYVLEKEYLYLSLEVSSQLAVPLACFRKNIDTREYIVSLSRDDNIYYVEICLEKTPIDLTQESFITQWILLYSITQKKVETFMKNYARKFSIDLNSIDKFIRTLKSITGTINGNLVKMEAPKTLFF